MVLEANTSDREQALHPKYAAGLVEEDVGKILIRLYTDGFVRCQQHALFPGPRATRPGSRMPCLRVDKRERVGAVVVSLWAVTDRATLTAAG